MTRRTVSAAKLRLKPPRARGSSFASLPQLYDVGLGRCLVVVALALAAGAGALPLEPESSARASTGSARGPEPAEGRPAREDPEFRRGADARQPRQGAPAIRTLTAQEMLDMMLGSSIQASRGDNTASAVLRVKEALAQGRTFTMIPVADMPDTWTIVTAGVVGGGGAWEYVRERTQRQKLPTVQDGVLKAIETLSRHTGKTFDAMVRVEAASATLSAFMTASALGVPVLDACLSGRSRPEVAQSIPFVNGLRSTPAALVTRWGDTLILDKAVDDYRFEDLARAIAVASGGSVSTASRAFSAREVKGAVIDGAVSEAILFGRTVREAREQGQDPVAALVKVAHGYTLFHGVVAKAVGKGEGGFTWWDVELKGLGEHAGHAYKISVKNENLVTWLDGVPDAMSPDYIAALDPRTGETHYSGELGGYKEGAEVVMVGWPASPLWRTPKGIEVFGPRHFGFDFDYVPIEQLQKQRKTSRERL